MTTTNEVMLPPGCIIWRCPSPRAEGKRMCEFHAAQPVPKVPDLRNREARNARVREKMADAAVRERKNAAARKRDKIRRATDPQWREHRNASRRVKRALDPEWRERENQRARDKRARAKAERLAELASL